MVLRCLTTEEIATLTNKKGLRAIAVENFCSSQGGQTAMEASLNLGMDARLYKWNAATVAAIRHGIRMGGQ